MIDVALRPEYRFGRTVVVVAVGDVLSQETEGIVIAANQRGVLGPLPVPGISGLRSLGGSAIERAAMARAPLDLGTALVTPAIGLEERGILGVIHAVVHPALGERARIEHVRRVTPAVLTAAATARLRSIAMPLLGVESRTPAPDVEMMVAALVDELVGGLRRSEPRINQVVLVCRFLEQANVVETALSRARQRVWLQIP
jgi:O-acetyl-ADP-ribose deacetylase (regulator of RNase III)